MAAPLFKDVGKAENDFMTKDFADKQFNISLKNVGSTQHVFNPSVTLNGGVFSGLWKSTFPLKNSGKLEWEYDTTTKCKATASFDNVVANVKAILGYETDPTKNGRTVRVGAEYKAPLLTSGLTFGYPVHTGKPTVNLNLVYLFRTNVTLAFDVDFSVADQQLPNKAAVVQYRHLNHAVFASYLAKGANHTCQLTYVVRNLVPANVSIGAQVAVDPLAKTTPDLTLVGAWPLDANSSLKASANSKGLGKLAYQLKPNVFTKVTAGVALDLTTFAAQKFGVSIDIE